MYGTRKKYLFTAWQFERLCRESAYVPLATDFKHAITMETLNYDRESAPQDHNDPFDRLLLAQAKSENMLFLTHDHGKTVDFARNQRFF